MSEDDCGARGANDGAHPFGPSTVLGSPSEVFAFGNQG